MPDTQPTDTTPVGEEGATDSTLLDTPVANEATPTAGETKGESAEPTQASNSDLLGGATPEGEKATGEEGQPKEEGNDVFGAPEKGYDFSKGEVEVAPEIATEFGALAKELDLSQATAQKIVDKLGPTVTNVEKQKLESLRSEWRSQSEGDSEFGGPALASNLRGIQAAYSEYASEGLQTLFKETGLANHPEVLRLFHRIAVKGKEGGFVKPAKQSVPATSITGFYKGLKD